MFLWLSLSQGSSLTSWHLSVALKPKRNHPKTCTDFTALPRRWFLYGLACDSLFRWRRNSNFRVTGPVRIPSLIFTLFCFTFLCPFDLKIKSEIQRQAKSSFPFCCAWGIAISSNLLATSFIHGHWWLSDSRMHRMDFAGVMLGLHHFLVKNTVKVCHGVSQYFLTPNNK